MENTYSLIHRLDTESRVEVRTRLTAKTVFVGNVFRAENIRERSRRLKTYFDPNDLIFFRSVKRFVDVYSWKTSTISLHPSTYYFLEAQEIRKVLTYSVDKKHLIIANLSDFNTLLDLGIGPLRRCSMIDTTQDDDFINLDVKTLYLKDSISTPLVKDELLKERKRRAQDVNPDQGGLF